MKIAVRANAQQKMELLSRPFPPDLICIWMDGPAPELPDSINAFFDLLFEEFGAVVVTDSSIPVFVNAVSSTCKELPVNFIRINAWPGFLNREKLEMAVCDENIKAAAEKILNTLNRPFQYVPDVVGMITPRIISMIINEAYFALGEKISTKSEIDIAMKLGTNYPFGPFEWSEKIGLEKCCQLLKKLAKDDPRYIPAPLLEEEVSILLLNKL